MPDAPRRAAPAWSRCHLLVRSADVGDEILGDRDRGRHIGERPGNGARSSARLEASKVNCLDHGKWSLKGGSGTCGRSPPVARLGITAVDKGGTPVWMDSAGDHSTMTVLPRVQSTGSVGMLRCGGDHRARTPEHAGRIRPPHWHRWPPFHRSPPSTWHRVASAWPAIAGTDWVAIRPMGRAPVTRGTDVGRPRAAALRGRPLAPGRTRTARFGTVNVTSWMVGRVVETSRGEQRRGHFRSKRGAR
jgi:hypothetical protein